MSSKMEVEESSSPGERVAVHPLALVHMSDHYTRITTGGSPLPRNAPVVGILFGSHHHHNDNNNNNNSSIVDAEDIPLDDPIKAVELHQAVFPNHTVVGFYRVSGQDDGVVEPTAADAQQVQTLQQQIVGGSPLYFGLLQVNHKQQQQQQANNNNNNNQDEALPLQIFTWQENVWIAVEDWYLTNAATAERIAVERVLRDKPADAEKQIQQAWAALDARLAILMEYLQQQEQQSTPTTNQQLELWRLVNGLLMQAQMLRTTAHHNSWLPQQVAILAKTMDAIAWYTDKFRLVHEVKGPATALLREGQRRF